MDGPTKGSASFGQGLTRDAGDPGRQHPALRPATTTDNVQARIAAIVVVTAIIAAVIYFAFFA